MGRGVHKNRKEETINLNTKIPLSVYRELSEYTTIQENTTSYLRDLVIRDLVIRDLNNKRPNE